MNRSRHGSCDDYEGQSNKYINHKERNLSIAQKALDSATNQLEIKERKLTELQDLIANLKSELDLEQCKNTTLEQELKKEKESSDVLIDVSRTNTCRLM